MRRRLLLVGVLAMTLAACGGSSATPSPSSSAGSSSAPSAASGTPAPPGASQAAPTTPAATQPAAANTSTAVCDGVSLRKSPSGTAAKVTTINSGTTVHVAATVNGTAYKAGACGTSGSTWLRIDKVGTKSVKSAYGVQYVYAAAGFFQ